MMKIAVTGDTHTPITPITSIKDMLDKMAKSNPDIVIHLGDIGETRTSIQYVDDVLRQMAATMPRAQIGAMAGNHDIWTAAYSHLNSMQLWTEILPQIAKNNSVLWLDNDNLLLDRVAIVGSYLHYEYSAKDVGGLASQEIKLTSGLSEDKYYEKFKYQVNNDGSFLIGLPPDKEFAATIGAEFRQRLQDAEEDPDIKDIVIVTHVPCMPSQVTRKPIDLKWSLGTPYFANLSHVSFIRSMSKVRYIFSGHSHEGNRTTVEFDDGHSVEVINLNSDYKKPTFEVIEL